MSDKDHTVTVNAKYLKELERLLSEALDLESYGSSGDYMLYIHAIAMSIERMKNNE